MVQTYQAYHNGIESIAVNDGKAHTADSCLMTAAA